MVALGLVFLVVAGASVAYLVFFSIPTSRAEAVDQWEQRLVAMAADREAALERWAHDLLTDAHTLAQYPTAQYVLSGREGPPYPFDPALEPTTHLRELLERFAAVHGIGSATLYDAAARPVVSTREDATPTAGMSRLIDAALDHEAGIDLVLEPWPQVVVAVPVMDGPGHPLGAIVTAVPADAFLFPYLRREPVPTETGETVLVSARNGQVVYLSPLRKRDGLAVRLPVDSTGLAGAVAAVGRAGPGEYVDYAGDTVLAVSRAVEGTSWAVVAKADAREVMGSYRTELARVVTAILGLLVGALGVAFGIWRWQRQRLAAAVVRARARFAALLDHANDPILFVDLDGRIVDVNRSAETFYGYSRDELIGERAHILRSPEDRPLAVDHMATALEEGTAVVPAEHRRADGTPIPVEISTRAAEIDGSTVMISIVRDIREREAAAEALRGSEERYRTLVGSLPDLIARFDRELRCTFMAPPAEDEPPFSVTDPVGREPHELGLPHEVADRLEEALRRSLRDGQTTTFEARHSGDQDLRTFDWRLVPERDPEGRVSSAVAIVRETTAQRELEEQLRQAQKMDAVGRLAGGVAHDFNNILTSIQGHAQLALDELDADHAVASDLEEIGRSAERAAALTRQLLAFSRRQIVEPRTIDTGTIVAEMAPMLRRLIDEHIELAVEIGDGPLTIRADPSQVEQVVLNLVINARDAMPEGGRLRIGVEQGLWPAVEPGEAGEEGAPGQEPDRSGEQAVRIAVADTGTGMDPDTVSRIFEPFFTTKAKEKGTGLGLSTVYGIIEQAGGRIDVESEPGRGTTFELLFPGVAPEDVPEAVPAAPSPETIELRGTILLVEDEAAVRRLARRVLEKDGYRVVETRSGVEALERAEAMETPPDLVVTDMVMPEMGGRELTIRLRERLPRCPVLLMSGYTEDSMIRDGKLDGGVSFIEKPFTPDDLRRKVAECLTHHPADGPSAA